VAELEKRMCTIQDSYTKLEQDKRKAEAELNEKVTELESHVQNLDNSAGEAFYYGNAQAETVMQFKQKIQEMERELMEV